MKDAQYGGSDSLYSGEWIHTHPTPEEIVFRKELGAGETAAIILAKKMNANLLLLDDLAARRVAAELNLSVSGTIGVLVAAHQKGLLPDLEKQLNALIACGFRISEHLLKSILAERKVSTV
ncbi:MAG: DUF3368 domain-containing protein [Deltaproteobacteria bacterium]|nr:DUF3368 domain-containing protein [Deltaproteobacteria bacterium]MBN2670845.1 DUF3368 domain-containing protein [Deltaproteobacteria bacterium]